MIEPSELTSAGRFIKTHGIRGELNAVIDVDTEFLDEERCFICDMDGIFTPFFIESVRPKGPHGILIKPEGIDDEIHAAEFTGKEFYVRRESLRAYETETYGEADEGEYADDMIGWKILDAETGELTGTITDLNLETANALFIVETPQGSTVYIPVSEEFIKEINHDEKTLSMTLPQGLLDLNN